MSLKKNEEKKRYCFLTQKALCIFCIRSKKRPENEGHENRIAHNVSHRLGIPCPPRFRSRGDVTFSLKEKLPHVVSRMILIDENGTRKEEYSARSFAAVPFDQSDDG